MTRLCLILLLCLLPPATAATLPQYDAALRQVQRALEARIPVLEAHEIPDGEPPQFVARRVLAPIQSVGPVDGLQQPVHNGALLRQLADADKRGDVSQMRALDGQIITLRATLAVSSPPSMRVTVGASDPVQLAHAVLARPEFDSTPYPPPPLIDRLADWLARQWDKIHWTPPNVNTPNINLPPPNFGFIRGLLYVLLAGAAAVLIAVLVQVLSRRQARAKAAPLLDEAEAALVEARDTDSLLALAERQAREGDHRRAFRLVYIATLVALDTGGVLRFNRSRTNWEYLRALRAAGRDDVYRALLPLTRDFDRVWYGFAPAGPSEYADAVAQYHALQSAGQPSAQPTPSRVGV